MLFRSEGFLSTPIPVVSAEAWPGLLNLYARVAPERTLGHVAVVALDCLGNQAPNVRFSAKGISETSLWYALDGGGLSYDGPTGSMGTAFFINVPPGPIEIDATAEATGQLSSHVTAVVRADALTEVNMAPSPF